MEVQEIIDRMKKRDEEALSYLFDNYGAALNGIILRILPSEQVAEEVLQQTFLKIWETIDQYDESKSTLFTWMSQIARNGAIDANLQNKDQTLQKAETSKVQTPTHQTSKSNAASIDTKKLIKKLDEQHRIVIDYIYFRGYSQSQTAAALQIPIDTVKTRLRFAMNELRTLLKDEKDLFLGALSVILILITYLCL